MEQWLQARGRKGLFALLERMEAMLRSIGTCMCMYYKGQPKLRKTPNNWQYMPPPTATTKINNPEPLNPINKTPEAPRHQIKSQSRAKALG